jgi:FkbM family methyltransferase
LTVAKVSNSIPVTAKLASQIVSFYRAWSPIQRGKHWLLRRTSSFLLAPIGQDLWIRATGVSGFEWKALNGEPGEGATTQLFLQLVKPGMTVFDVGSNVGYYSLLAAKAVGRGGQVHAFEATPAVARRIGENVALNGLDNVTVNHSAVCDRVGEIEFRLQADDSEGNSLVNYEAGWGCVRVPAMTLDQYVVDHELAGVDVMKIDVEGAEEMVLAGATRLLSRPVPPLLILESNAAALRAAGTSPETICSMLNSFGYRCLGIELLLPEPDAVWNFLAIHPAHHLEDLASRLESFPPNPS